MTIIYHRQFLKAYKKQSSKIRLKFKKRLILFIKDEFDPTLNNHALAGKYHGYRSINITGDLRAIFKTTPKEIIFTTIDSHSNLYR